MGPIPAFVEPYLSDPALRRITLSGGSGVVRKAVLRPVEVRGARVVQVVTYDERRSTTANVGGWDAAEVADVLALPFRHVVVDRGDEVLEGRVTKKGNVVSSRTRVADAGPLVLSHDREKSQPIAMDAPFLDVLGRVRPPKFRQINEFVRLLDGGLPELRGGVRIVDFGCGNAYLTFAAAHHLAGMSVPFEIVGVDRNEELIDRNNERAALLGWSDALRFVVGDIESYTPEAVPPSIVVALHACDTGSDLALAAAVRWSAELALVAPCCHHQVHAQLRPSSVSSAGDALLLRHGILRERFGDLLTDSLRAAVMRLLGYDVDVVEFVDPEHTPRNVLIRAARRSLPAPEGLASAYTDALRQWSVTPLLGELLADELAAVGVR